MPDDTTTPTAAPTASSAAPTANTTGTTTYSTQTLPNSDGSGAETTVYTPQPPGSVIPSVVPSPSPVTTINTGNATPSNPPQQPVPSTDNSAHTTLGASLAGYGANLQSAAAAQQPTDTTGSGNDLHDVLANILQLDQKMGTQGQATDAANTEFGVYDKAQNAQQLSDEYQARSRYYDDQIRALQSGPNSQGLSADAIQERVDELTRQKNLELGDIAIQQSAAAGDLKNAQTFAQQKIDAEFQPIQNQINSLKDYYTLAQNDMTESEKEQAQAAITAKQDAVNQQYAMQQKAYDYYIQYGVWPAGVPGAPSGADTAPADLSGNSGGTVVGGIDFGNVPGVGAYATDINSEVSGVQRNYDAIPGSDAASIQSYIDNNAPNSQVTGQMIVDAANAQGIDPKVLAATLANESNFGTTGAGAKTNNPGNVGNTDDGTTNTLSSWQDGVNAAAEQLARRKADTSTNLVSAPINPASPIQSSSSDFKNGVPVTAAGALASTNPSDQQAYALATGGAAPSQYISGRTATSAAGRQLLNRANAISMQLYGTPFDAATAETAYHFRQSATYQNFTVNTPTAISTIIQAAQAAKDLNLTNFGALNSAKIDALAAGLYPFGTPKMQQDATVLKSLLSLNKDDLGLILGAGTGSDQKTALAGLIFNTTGSPQSTEAITNNLVNKITEKLGNYYTAANATPTGKAMAQKMAAQNAQEWVNQALSDSGAVNTSGTAQEGDTHVYNGTTYVVKNGQWVPQ